MKHTHTHTHTKSTLLEQEMATHSSNLAWRIPWTEEAGRLPNSPWSRKASTRLSGLAPAFQMLFSITSLDGDQRIYFPTMDWRKSTAPTATLHRVKGTRSLLSLHSFYFIYLLFRQRCTDVFHYHLAFTVNFKNSLFKSTTI